MGLLSQLFSQPRGEKRPGHLSFLASRTVLRIALLLVAYYLASRLSTAFAILPGTGSLLSPQAAIAVYACLVFGFGMGPAIWAAATLSLLDTGVQAWPALGSGFAAMLEAWIAVSLIQTVYRTRTEFLFRSSIFPFVGIALLASAVAASLTLLVRTMASDTLPDAAGTWLAIWFGDAIGMTVGLPLLLSWKALPHPDRSAAKIAEAAVVVVLLAVLTHLAFGGFFGSWPIAYLSIPLILWIAFRFHFSAVAAATAILCGVAAWNTAQGRGPFAVPDHTTSLLLLAIYISVISTTALALSNLIHLRHAADLKLRSERDTLEHHVRDRTRSLVEYIKARKQVEARLATRERQLAEAQKLAQIGSWNWEMDTNTITWSDQLYRICGVSKDKFKVTCERWQAFVHQEDVAVLNRCMEDSRHHGHPFHLEHRLLPRGGGLRFVASRGQADRAADGRIVRLFGTIQDITDSKRAQASLREAEERYRKVVEVSPDAILVLQDGRIAFANPAAEQLLGADHSLEGRTLFNLLHPDFHAPMQDCLAQLEHGEAVPAAEQQLIRLDGSLVDVETCASPFLHLGRFAALFIVRDITERKKNLEQMAYLAHYDSLTGLANRALFMQRLAHALTIAERPGRSLEVLFLDLNRFKHINDSLGHAAGDSLLKETATRLQSILRESDTVARLGGDEFVVLVENVDEHELHRGGTIAQKILAAFGPPVQIGKEFVHISTSIGISSYPTDGTDVDTLLKHADDAMYRAKQMGPDVYQYYSEELNEHTSERLALENALSQAIGLGQLTLHYQPRIGVLSNRVLGMEALLRWQHPTRGAIEPRQFIPIAEESGLIMNIGYWTIRTACLQNKQWQAITGVPLRVAVNLSCRQLADDDLIANIEEILRDTGLPPQFLELELPENALLPDPNRATATLRRLRELGVGVALDNFGTGYTSLARLKEFHIQAVKIDRSFIQGLPGSISDSAVARAIIQLAHGLECSVIAEGTETQQQFDFLRENNCDSIQGYYFSGPMSPDMFAELIMTQDMSRVH